MTEIRERENVSRQGMQVVFQLPFVCLPRVDADCFRRICMRCSDTRQEWSLGFGVAFGGEKRRRESKGEIDFSNSV